MWRGLETGDQLVEPFVLELDDPLSDQEDRLAEAVEHVLDLL